MNYEAEVFYENGIVHVRMSGVDSYAANLDAFSRMVACCKEFNCYAVLGIQNMTPLSTVDAFEVTHIFEQLSERCRRDLKMINPANTQQIQQARP